MSDVKEGGQLNTTEKFFWIEERSIKSIKKHFSTAQLYLSWAETEEKKHEAKGFWSIGTSENIVSNIEKTHVKVTLLRELLQVRLERMPVAQVSMLTSSEPSWVTKICSRPSRPSCRERRRTEEMAERANIRGPNYLPHYPHSVSKSRFSFFQSVHHIVRSNLLPKQRVGKNVGLQTQLWIVFNMLWKNWPRSSNFSIWGYPQQQWGSKTSCRIKSILSITSLLTYPFKMMIHHTFILFMMPFHNLWCKWLVLLWCIYFTS